MGPMLALGTSAMGMVDPADKDGRDMGGGIRLLVDWLFNELLRLSDIELAVVQLLLLRFG